MKKIFWCKNCLNMSTRPRITFDERGWCNACVWMEEKKSLDWGKREEELLNLFAKHKSKNSEFDCVVPVSGGKDSHYQTYMIKEEFGLNPLVVAFRPREWTELGRKNLENLKKQFNVDCIEFTPKRDIYLKMQKIGLLDSFIFFAALIQLNGL